MKTDVVIVGGGPVGLGAALALGRLGVNVVLFERRNTTSYHPRGHVVNQRTLEIFRSWNIADEVITASMPNERAGAFFGSRLTQPMVGEIVAQGESEEEDIRTASFSPYLKTSCPQDLLEPIIKKEAESYANVDLRFGHRVVSLRQDDVAVFVKVVDEQGVRSEVEARFVIAADGANGQVRNWLDVEMQGIENMGNQMGVYFHADLRSYIEDKPYLLYWIYNRDTTGVFIAMDVHDRWTYNFLYDPDEVNPESFTKEKATEIVRAAIGDTEVALDIKSCNPWSMQARTAEKIRIGNVFLAGDAAHPLPPTGGQGTNTGIGDVHNLAWKIALVLDGVAKDSILDSYSSERLPIARFNVAQSARNAQNMGKAGLGSALKVPAEIIEAFETRDKQLLKPVRKAIARQREHFNYHGQVFGQQYSSSTIIPDTSDPVPFEVELYQPNARPGSRAPHAWLDESKKLSTLDFFRGKSFTLIMQSEGVEFWRDAAVTAAKRFDLDLAVVTVGLGGEYPNADPALVTLYGVTETGAVLVRPDGYVAFRVHDASDPQNFYELFDVVLGSST